MKRLGALGLLILTVWIALGGMACQSAKTDNMEWWREARFGLFIHWGLYAVPAGEWNGETNHAEWIRQTAQIPVETYEKFVDQFNPVKFDAKEWVRMAKEAGMKYIVITSKHHDGFCLFDSRYTDFDIMSTPFKRDIMKELADAAHAAGIKICWYHSIMDWHHPDYLPRRDWERDTRTAEGADMDRYVAYMKNQLEELVTKYGDIGVLWFDGEWEETWTPEMGWDLYRFLKDMDPGLIINNRIGKGRSGMEGMNKEGEFAGDFGTPEQEIPATGLPNVDWETCMTMNDHWGYNKHDHNWKSTEDLLRKLADIASKGGNFLLNVGPTAEGLFPQASIDRLKAMGEWMKVNGESIYGTKASPFAHLDWGRCTQKAIQGGTRLYLHVFDWPKDGKLIVPDIFNTPIKASLLMNPQSSLQIQQLEAEYVITLPEKQPDPVNTVIALDIKGKADISTPPAIKADAGIFLDQLDVSLESAQDNVRIRYTLDGSKPTKDSPVFSGKIHLKKSALVTAQSYRSSKPVSSSVSRSFEKVAPKPAMTTKKAKPGIAYKYYTGKWNKMPKFNKLKPFKTGVSKTVDLSMRQHEDYYAVQYYGLINIPKDGIYILSIESDDGSLLWLDGELIADNDGVHSTTGKTAIVALGKGLHALQADYFENSGEAVLRAFIEGPDLEKQIIPEGMLYH